MENNMIIQVRDLNKSYGSRQVLKDVSFDLPKGKIIGLLGPNGCGKTTLMKILTGIIHDYDGTVLIDGHSPGIHTKGLTAYMSERTYLADWFKASDAINFFSDFFADFDKNKAYDFAGAFDLDLRQNVRTMSKGMQEKMQLLLIMSRSAKLYLLDEPLGGVDPAARAMILDIIMKNYAQDSTLMLSTHIINDLEKSFDHVMMLGNGSILVNTGIETIKNTGKSVEDVFKEMIGYAW